VPALALCALCAGCGDDDAGSGGSRPADRGVPPGAPDSEHAREVARDPFKLTCADLARQPRHPDSQHLVIQAEFALARVPALRERRRELTLNRTGRSVYYALTEICKGRHPAFEPGRHAVAAVRSGRYTAALNRPG
jgi:hypothetical protein